VAIDTSRTSRQPLFANNQTHRITQTIEIKIPAGASNEAGALPSDRLEATVLARRRRIGSAAQVLA
jgi:hypothetical protein